MIALIVAGTVLLAASVWYLARPLAVASAADTGEERFQLQQVRDRLMAQLNELDAEARDKSMDATTVEDERTRLEAELAQVLRQIETFTPPASAATGVPGRSVWLSALLIMGILLAAGGGGLYYYNQRELLTFLAGGGARSNLPPQAMEMVARLEKRLAENPDDAAGWARLGRSYAVMGRAGEARSAYARALTLAPDNVEALAEFAWLLFSENPQNTQGEVFGLYQRLNRLQPDNQDALWFLGVASYQRNDRAQAIRFWERLLKTFPAQSQGADQVRAAIAKARAR